LLSSVIEDAAGAGVGELVRVASNPSSCGRHGRFRLPAPGRVVIGADDSSALDDIVELYQPVLDQSFPGY